MENPDFVVHPFDQSQTDFVLGMTVGGNAIPMGGNQLGKLPIWLQSLPVQAVLPALEKGTCSAFGVVVPQLSEAFLEDVGGVQPPVGLNQCFQGPSSIRTQVLTPRLWLS